MNARIIRSTQKWSSDGFQISAFIIGPLRAPVNRSCRKLHCRDGFPLILAWTAIRDACSSKA